MRDLPLMSDSFSSPQNEPERGTQQRANPGFPTASFQTGLLQELTKGVKNEPQPPRFALGLCGPCPLWVSIRVPQLQVIPLHSHIPSGVSPIRWHNEPLSNPASFDLAVVVRTIRCWLQLTVAATLKAVVESGETDICRFSPCIDIPKRSWYRLFFMALFVLAKLFLQGSIERSTGFSGSWANTAE